MFSKFGKAAGAWPSLKESLVMNSRLNTTANAAGQGASRLIVVVDDEIEGDKRVAAFIERLGAGKSVHVVDIRAPGAGGVLQIMAALAGFTRLLAGGLRAGFRKRQKIQHLLDKERFVSKGFVRSLQWLWRACRSRRRIADMAPGAADMIYAADLHAALAATMGAPADVPMLYDSHELQIHRNRKKDKLRILLEFGLERMVISRADDVATVCAPIAGLLESWHDLAPGSIEIVHNNFYAPQPLPDPLPGPDAPPAIVYVGMGLIGRGLEKLDTEELPFIFRVYTLGRELPPSLKGRAWSFGPVDYLEDLKAFRRRHRCMMWCAAEPSCLSYELSLPNKFFQALALGMPIIATPGTYLAELISRYDIGMTDEGLSLEDIARAMRAPDFERWVKNAVQLQQLLRAGQVRL